jgi:hypothetical protein
MSIPRPYIWMKDMPEMLPCDHVSYRWYYGLAWESIYSDSRLVVILPFNLVIRFGWRLYQRVRYSRGRFDRVVRRAYRVGWCDGRQGIERDYASLAKEIEQ